MYGRPAESAASSMSLSSGFRQFNYSDSFCSIDLRAPSGFSGRAPFFSPRLIEARKLLMIPQVIAPRLHFCRGKRWGSRAPHTGVTISNSFSSRPRRFHARPPKVERSVRTDGYRAPFNRPRLARGQNRFRRREKRSGIKLNVRRASRYDTPGVKSLAAESEIGISRELIYDVRLKSRCPAAEHRDFLRIIFSRTWKFNFSQWNTSGEIIIYSFISALTLDWSKRSLAGDFSSSREKLSFINRSLLFSLLAREKVTCWRSRLFFSRGSSMGCSTWSADRPTRWCNLACARVESVLRSSGRLTRHRGLASSYDFGPVALACLANALCHPYSPLPLASPRPNSSWLALTCLLA